MENMIKKANTLYVASHRPSNDGLISPQGESIKFVLQSPNSRDAKHTNRINKTSLLELKKSRKLALEYQMKRLNNKRRLMKTFRKVYLISMFLSIAKQMDSKKLKGNHKKKIHESLIYPEDRLKKLWDIFMLIILIYCSFYIPFVAAFEDEEIIYSVSKWIFSIIFSVDIIILMRMCYYDENNNLVQDSISIIKHYLFGWFIIDMISVIPFQYCQLIKVFRIKRVSQIVSSSSLNQNKILEFMYNFLDVKQATLFQILFFSLIGFHYSTCLWALSRQWSDQGIPKYIDAIYWAMQTLSTTGYGDVTPTSMIEYISTIICTLCGGIFMSLVIGNLSSILADIDTESQFNTTLNNLKVLFNQVIILPEYKTEISNFILTNHKHNQSWSLNQQEWFKILPQDLQNKILLAVAKKELLGISLFRISIPFSLKVIRHISLMKAKAGQLIWLKGDPVDEIYFLVEGMVQYRNQFGKELLEIQPGSIFGEQEYFNRRQIIQRQQQRSQYAIAKKDCYYLIIRNSHFFKYLKEFPALQKYLQMLVEHRLDDILIRFKQYEIEAEKERVSAQKLELIKSANRIEVRDYKGIIKHKQSVIYDTRQSNTESILEKLLKNRITKINMLMDRFRKVVQMIIFANRTLDKQYLSSKTTSIQNSQTNLYTKKVKSNQVLPMGILLKMRQKFIEIKQLKKISLAKRNEFKKVFQALFQNNNNVINQLPRNDSQEIQEKKKNVVLIRNPSQKLDEFFTQMKVLQRNLNLAQWAIQESQKDLEKEMQSINRLFDKQDFSKMI
ncbi:unnamed protein product [Paramecium pentaurelia]|uniref:Cyclic nucleotide-binding domain-containing protein n=1 Tax=Paramecium pentaurelia TaxID=43138 RepID=A0A8S1THJ7_9CILI|nr:unnamed protein product [Paramecium pentaurelia]